jgi:hypothetical protein
MNLPSEMYSTVRKGMPSVVKVCCLEVKDKREEDGKMVSDISVRANRWWSLSREVAYEEGLGEHM